MNQDVHIFGIRLLGVSQESLDKLLLSAIAAAILLAIRQLLHWIAKQATRRRSCAL